MYIRLHSEVKRRCLFTYVKLRLVSSFRKNLVVCGCLLVVCGRFLMVWDRLSWFVFVFMWFVVICGGLRWFLIVASFSHYDFWEPSLRELLKNTNKDTPIAIAMNNDTGIFLFFSYARGYHVCMKVCNAVTDDSLQCNTSAMFISKRVNRDAGCPLYNMFAMCSFDCITN